MSPENFIYWLQGFFELTYSKSLDAIQTQVVKDHLKLVLKKETPERVEPENNKPILLPTQSISSSLYRNNTGHLTCGIGPRTYGVCYLGHPTCSAHPQFNPYIQHWSEEMDSLAYLSQSNIPLMSCSLYPLYPQRSVHGGGRIC